MNKIQQLVEQYKHPEGKEEITYREFADEFSELLADPVTYQTIHNWHHGSTSPNVITMFYALQVYREGDWRREFAEQVLDVLLPDNGMEQAV